MSRLQISGRQLAYITLFGGLGPVFCLVSQTLILAAGRDTWIGVGAAALAASGVGYAIALGAGREPLTDTLARVISVPGARVAAAIYVLLSVNAAQFGIRFGSEVIITGLTPYSPVGLYVGGFAVLCLATAGQGLEVAARMCELLGPVVLAILVILALFALPLVEWPDFRPLLQTPLLQVGLAGWVSASYLLEWALIAVVIVSHVRSETPALAAAQGGTGAALVLFAAIVLILGLFGPEEASRLVFGFLHVTRHASVFEVVRGAESIFVFPWIALIYLKSALHLATAALVIERISRFKAERTGALLALVIIAPAVIIPSQGLAVLINLRVTTLVTLPYVLVLGVIFAIDRIKSRGVSR